MRSAADSWGDYDLLLFRSVTTQSIGGHLKLLGPITEAEEAQDPQEDPDRFGADQLDRTHVDGLRIIAEPASINQPTVMRMIFRGSRLTNYQSRHA